MSANLIHKKNINKEPNYNAKDENLGLIVQLCPNNKTEEITEQKIKKIYYTDLNGSPLDNITNEVEKEILLIVESENMVGEEIVIDLSGNYGDFIYNDELVTEEKVLKLLVNSNEEKIKLKVKQIDFEEEEIIRGTKKSDFTATCGGADDETKEKLWEDFKNEDWESMEKTVKEKNINNGKWPPNDGFKSKEVITLKKGTSIDRYDGDDPTKDRGKFASPTGADFSSRALPEKDKNRPQYDYTVEEDIEVTAGEAIPWFGQEGGGTQYKTEESFKDLLKKGKIKVKK